MGKRRHVLKGMAAAGLAPVWLPATLLAATPISQARFADVNAALVSDHAAPRFQRFAEATAAQARTLATYCAGDATMVEIHGAFDHAFDAWMGVQHLRFGAVEEQMRDFRVQFWPDQGNRVGKQLAEALDEERQDLLDPAVMAEASVALQGFPALERLLFTERVAPGTYGCELAVAIGDNLVAMAADMATAWSPGGATATMLLMPAEGARFANPSDATAAFLGAMAVQLEFIALRKLNAPMAESAQKSRPKTAEAWRSGRSLDHVNTNLVALIELYDGVDDKPGLSALVVEAGYPSHDDELRALLNEILATTSTLGSDLTVIVEDEAARPPLLTAIDQTEEARHLVAGDIAGALGLVLGFNSLDGD